MAKELMKDVVSGYMSSIGRKGGMNGKGVKKCRLLPNGEVDREFYRAIAAKSLAARMRNKEKAMEKAGSEAEKPIQTEEVNQHVPKRDDDLQARIAKLLKRKGLDE